MIQTTIGAFTLGSIKAFRGHEGETCLQGTLLKDGKKVAEWSEDSWGGPMRFDFTSKDLQTSFFEAANQHPVAVEFAKEMEEKYGKSKIVDNNHADLVVSTIAQEIDLQRRQEAQLKRWCKAKIVLRNPADAEGDFVTIKMAYNPKHDAELAKRYPGFEIVNKRFL